MSGMDMKISYEPRLCEVNGIVEFKDGVRRVDPVDIHFCDEQHQILANWPEKGEI